MKASTPYATQPAVDELDLDALAPGELHHLMVDIVTNALGVWTWIPVLVARGHAPGPVVAVTGAVHGNELNGIRIVQRLFHRLRGEGLRGTVVGVPIVNVPGYRDNRREFIDGHDLNRIMPGREDGNCAEVYAHRVLTRVVSRADYLIDLHTASAGRVNSIYVRADMTNPITAHMALLQQAQIIVHNEGRDGTLRGAVGVPAITVEVGDPQRFQRGAIRDGVDGVENVLVDLGMLPNRELKRGEDAVLCSRSYWIYTDTGGVLEVFPQLRDRVERGERIARVSSIFGDVIREHQAPEHGIVVGKSISPVNRTGARILHLGVVGSPEGACEPVPSLAERHSSSS